MSSARSYNKYLVNRRIWTSLSKMLTAMVEGWEQGGEREGSMIDSLTRTTWNKEQLSQEEGNSVYRHVRMKKC